MGPCGTAWCVGHGFMSYESCAEIGKQRFQTLIFLGRTQTENSWVSHMWTHKPKRKHFGFELSSVTLYKRHEVKKRSFANRDRCFASVQEIWKRTPTRERLSEKGLAQGPCRKLQSLLLPWTHSI